MKNYLLWPRGRSSNLLKIRSEFYRCVHKEVIDSLYVGLGLTDLEEYSQQAYFQSIEKANKAMIEDQKKIGRDMIHAMEKFHSETFSDEGTDRLANV